MQTEQREGLNRFCSVKLKNFLLKLSLISGGQIKATTVLLTVIGLKIRVRMFVERTMTKLMYTCYCERVILFTFYWRQ